MLWTVGVTTVAWLAVTWLTPPESPETLEAFYRRVRPGGPGWRTVARRLGYETDRIPGGALSWVNWVAGWLAVFATLAGTGQLLLGSRLWGAVGLAGAAGALALIVRNLRSDHSLAREARQPHFEAAVDSPPGPA
jgi:hypothetical protein